MSNRRTPSVLRALYFFVALITLVVAIASCGSSAVSPSSSNTKLIIVNTSPDAGPIVAFINNSQLGSSTGVVSTRTYFRYSTTPTYYSIGSGYLTIQLRSDHNVIFSSQLDTVVADKSYSLYLMGLKSIDSLTAIFVNDNATIPPLGSGKVRFINASPRTPALDVTANGTTAFSKITYKKVSDYVELPVGVYDFKLTANGAPSSVLTTLSRFTVLDGKLYTLYTKGMVGRTDTAAISLNMITHK